MSMQTIQGACVVGLCGLLAATGAGCSASSTDTSSPSHGGSSSSQGGSSSGGSTASGGTGLVGNGGTSEGGTSPIAGSGGNVTNGGAPAGGTSSGGTTAAGSGGSGVAGSGGANPGGSVCGGAGTRVFTADAAGAFVDDFESGKIADGWYAFNDLGTKGADASDGMFKIMLQAGGAPTTPVTANSGHYAGTGANAPTAGGFGVGLQYNIVVDKANGIYCGDLSAFDGVSFWAKGKAASTITTNFIVPSQNAVADGGDCDTTSTSGCYNHPQVKLTLTTDWQQYAVPFADAKGAGPTAAKVVNNLVQGLLWLSGDKDWDFSLDEIAFYKGTAPKGPVAPK